MPKFMLLAAMLLLPTVAQANEWFQSEKPVTCGPFREIVEILLQDRYREVPLWIGQSSQDATQFSLFLNEKTGAWTLVQYGKKAGCILGIGDRSDIVNLAPWGERH